MTHADALRTLAAERYLLDEMSEIEKFAFEDHFFDCAECADDVRAGSAMRAGAKAAQPGSGCRCDVAAGGDPDGRGQTTLDSRRRGALGGGGDAGARRRLPIAHTWKWRPPDRHAHAGDNQARQPGSGAHRVYWQRCQGGDAGAGRRRPRTCGSDICAPNLSRSAGRRRSNYGSSRRNPRFSCSYLSGH